MTKNLILLGDSIFDNKLYVPPGGTVSDHLLKTLDTDKWNVSLLAEDGSVINDVWEQCKNIPKDITCIALSVGGNDLLKQIGILYDRVENVNEALLRIKKIGDSFRKQYTGIVKYLIGLEKPLVICTVYNPNFIGSKIESFQKGAEVVISVINDIIISVGQENNVAVLDIRNVFTELGDYANTIEPSSQGGKKLAEAFRIALKFFEESDMVDEENPAILKTSEYGKINPVLWYHVLKAVRSRQGMGSININSNPYTGQWECDISFFDDRHFMGKDSYLNIALQLALDSLKLDTEN